MVKQNTIDDIFLNQGIDSKGMDDNDRKYLEALKNNVGNPIGIKSLSSMTGISMETIENSIEPYLVRSGFVVRYTKRKSLLIQAWYKNH